MKVKIEIDRDLAEEIHFGLADLACWHRGYAAASRGMFDELSPEGIDRLREIMRLINKGIADAKDEAKASQALFSAMANRNKPSDEDII